MTTSNHEITPEDICRIWPVATPARIRRTVHGANNRSYIVDCEENTYVLKGHDNSPDHERLLFVNRLTAAIAATHPPFAVPRTILSRSGEAHILYGGRSWTLSTFITGSAARAGDPDDAAACGRALAELHAALTRVPFAPRDRDRHTSGDLAKVHPLVPDPARAIREAIGDATLAEEATTILEAVQSRAASVTAGWPLTWIHWDFYPSNVLMESHRVTGIVDFEVAGPGFRAMDVTIGLYAFAHGQPGMWTLVERFATGYLGRLPLSAGEIEAVPTLMLMREAVSLVHWTGRSLQGLPDWAGVPHRARRLVDLAQFLDGTGADLVRRLHAISSRAG